MNEFLRYPYTEVDLDVVHVAARNHVAREFMVNTELRSWHAPILDGLVVELHKKVMAYEHGRESSVSEMVELTHEVPASWWQHFKAEAIKWGNPIFNPAKVKYTKVVKRARLKASYRLLTAFPEMPYVIPEGGRPIRMIVQAGSKIERFDQ